MKSNKHAADWFVARDYAFRLLNFENTIIAIPARLDSSRLPNKLVAQN